MRLPNARAIWIAALVASCGPSAAKPAAQTPVAATSASAPVPAPVETPEEPVPTLRTGEIPPVEHPGSIAAKVIGRFADERFETIALEIVLPLRAAFDWSERVGSRVTVDGDGTAPYAFAAIPDDVSSVEGRGLGAATVWVRRSKDREGQSISGVVFTPQLGGDPGHKVRFATSADAKPKSDPKVLARWAAALGRHFRELGSGPWFGFAAARIDEVYGEKKKGKAPDVPLARRDSDDLARLMETTTGMLSIQEALQHDRPLLLALAKDKASIPIAKLSPPKAKPHPWKEMLASLPAQAPPDPLAQAIPAEFWYARAEDIGTLFRLADEIDEWGTGAVMATDRHLSERDLDARYETELGLSRSALGRALGREVVEALAVTGSDPYFREGTDLTLVFRVKQKALFQAALESMLSGHARTHGGTTKATLAHEGADISVVKSPDGAIRQHRASAREFEIVSNSAAATRRVLDAIAGRRPRLADEGDFRYMLARDPTDRSALFAFFGDKFVAEVVGPRQKVLETRRQLAAAELATPGYAALLHGWVFGKSPASADELIASKLLRQGELKHASGTAIEWRVGEGARSSWGTPAALTPLIDLPAPDRVSESERAAYERFSRTYETYWSQYIDPAALRVGAAEPGTNRLQADLRVLPLIDGTEYRDIVELAGQARVKTTAPRDGIRAVVAIGPSAPVRRELSSLASANLGRHSFQLDFLGDWAMVGLADRARVADVARKVYPFPQAPEPESIGRPDEIAEAARLPLYAAVAIRSNSGAALALASIRKMADETLRDNASWSDAGSERGVSIVRVSVGKEIHVFYALTDKAFLLSLDESVLRRLVDDFAEGRSPTMASTSDGAQLAFDLAQSPGGGIFTVLGWALAEQLMNASGSSRADAEALLRGAPDKASDPRAFRALASAYFGSAPVPPFGGEYKLAADGINDPVLGSASFPRFPSVPPAGSPIERALSALARFRSEISFDSELGADARSMRSLHVRATVERRSP